MIRNHKTKLSVGLLSAGTSYRIRKGLILALIDMLQVFAFAAMFPYLQTQLFILIAVILFIFIDLAFFTRMPGKVEHVYALLGGTPE